MNNPLLTDISGALEFSIYVHIKWDEDDETAQATAITPNLGLAAVDVYTLMFLFHTWGWAQNKLFLKEGIHFLLKYMRIKVNDRSPRTDKYWSVWETISLLRMGVAWLYRLSLMKGALQCSMYMFANKMCERSVWFTSQVHIKPVNNKLIKWNQVIMNWSQV